MPQNTVSEKQAKAKCDIEGKLSLRTALHLPQTLPTVRPALLNDQQKQIFVAFMANLLGVDEAKLPTIEVQIPLGVRCPLLCGPLHKLTVAISFLQVVGEDLSQFKSIQLGKSDIHRYFKGTSRLPGPSVWFSDRCAADPLQSWRSPQHLALLRGEVARLRKAVRSRREGATATGVARMGARGAVGGMAQNEARGQVRRAAGGRTASSRTPRPSWMDCGNALVGSSPTMYAHMLKAAEVWRTPPAVGTTPACACRPTGQEAVSTSSGDDDENLGA